MLRIAFFPHFNAFRLLREPGRRDGRRLRDVHGAPRGRLPLHGARLHPRHAQGTHVHQVGDVDFSTKCKVVEQKILDNRSLAFCHKLNMLTVFDNESKFKL